MYLPTSGILQCPKGVSGRDKLRSDRYCDTRWLHHPQVRVAAIAALDFAGDAGNMFYTEAQG